jgi:hypothetical protein
MGRWVIQEAEDVSAAGFVQNAQDESGAGLYTVVHTEYTELQPLLSGVNSVMRVKLALAGEGGGCTPTPSYYIYHHQ